MTNHTLYFNANPSHRALEAKRNLLQFASTAF